jgi:peptidoglycan-associated lipoprotein
VQVNKAELGHAISSNLIGDNRDFVNSDASSLLVYFAFDSALLPMGISDVLDPHVNYLNTNQNAHVIVEGHTDSVGTPEYNIALGEKRAKRVVQYLIDRGVMYSQLSVVSYGEEKMASRSEPSKNRRVVISYR